MTNRKRDTGCPIAYALDIFGDRWSLIVIRDLLFKGIQTYSELLKADEGIATNILANRLKGFEASGIISKTRNPDNRRQSIYNITRKGAELAPVLIEMMQWSARYDRNTRVSDALLEKINKDREGFIRNIQHRALSRNQPLIPEKK
ncbi:Transcriptional regulator, HxlR family [hydrothermal vent metagenome]|uniref:Transcriptional regulator, HxlR family n=1 Tax=hydrothermal vent metagenome TaxID=652676 RepID=A0A3B0XQR4_9ZZZZ